MKPTPSKRRSSKCQKQSATAWAWLFEGGLCKWAEPDKNRLIVQGKPSPEAVPVRVRMTVI